METHNLLVAVDRVLMRSVKSISMLKYMDRQLSSGRLSSIKPSRDAQRASSSFPGHHWLKIKTR